MKSSTDATELGSVKFSEFTQGDSLALADRLFHEGRLAEARHILRETLISSTGDERLFTALYLAVVESEAGNLPQALEILASHYTLAKLSENHSIVWRYHSTYGAAWQLLAERGGKPEHYDRALEEYAGAAYHMDLAGDHRRAGITRNNIALILSEQGRKAEAFEQLTEAREQLQGCPVTLAEVDDTEGRICLKVGMIGEAVELFLKANLVFMQHGETRLFVKSSRFLEEATTKYRGGVVDCLTS